MTASSETWTASLRSAPRVVVLFFVALLVVAYLLQLPRKPSKTDNIPWGLTYMKFLPRWISGTVHTRFATQIMESASRRYPKSPFRLARHDIDLVMLPESIVNELAGLPNATASNILALQYDLVGGWCGLGMLNDADLHSRVVHRRITPNLARLAPELEDEVADCFSSYFPQQEDGWVEVTPYHIMNRIAARVFSRIVVGPKYCRDERWLDFAMNFTENVFNSIVFMRYFPPWTYRLFYYILPSVGECIKNIRQAEDLLVPVFTQLLKSQDKNATDLTDDTNCLAWLCELANDGERDPKTLVHSQILLALGAIHTSLFAELNILYDLMSHPEEIETIRNEVASVAKSGWSYSSYSELHKLDSILRESQRLSPPFMIGLRRVMKEDYTFANGISVKQGEYVCVFTPTVQNAHIPADEDPEAFYGLRSYHKKAGEDGFNSTKHLFSTTDTSVLGFGHGRTACPGRFSASLALKVIFAKLMTEYDFRFPDGGTTRPKSLRSNEIISPDPRVRIQMRKRDLSFVPY